MTRARAAALAALLLVSACVGPRRDAPPPIGSEPAPLPVPVPVPPPPPAPPPPANALAAGVELVPGVPVLTQEAAWRAYNAFKISCPALLRRTDASGLTQGAHWQPACTSLLTDPLAGAARWFADHFEQVRVGRDPAFATGYYEPEIRGARQPGPGYTTPIYAKPADLVRASFADGTTGRGRTDETGAHVLYHDRAAIESGALAGKGLEIAWAADPVELFFLQIQGSGRLKLADGSVMRIGYADQNGREYVAIGRLLRERGVLQSGGTSMQSIQAWIRANPAEGRALMQENKSYVFFRELIGPGPLGALELPVTPRATVAADPKFVPLGAPVLLAMDKPEASGLWIAQDTGGAIKGANRFDTFWGAGEEAARIAGGMQARGEALILLPKGSVARLRAAAGDALARP